MTERPWQKAKTPPELPAFTNAGDLREFALTVEFPVIVAQHLDPRSRDPRYITHWRNFWQVIGLDKSLSATTETLLEAFLEAAKQQLDAGDLDSLEQGRIERFADRCIKALDRLDRTHEEPLAWAGPRAAEFNPRAREVIDQLVQAIATHRRTGDDPALWQVLTELHLDPDTGPRPKK